MKNQTIFATTSSRLHCYALRLDLDMSSRLKHSQVIEDVDRATEPISEMTSATIQSVTKQHRNTSGNVGQEMTRDFPTSLHV